jgi:hypothetical protein
MWMRRRCHYKNHVTGSAKYCNTVLGFVMVASCCSCGSRHRGGSWRNCVASRVPMGGFRSGLQVGIVGSGNFNALTLLSRLFRWDYLLGIDTFCWPGSLFTVLKFWSVDICDSLPPIEAGFVARLGHHKTTTLVSPHMPLSSTEVFWSLFRSLQFEVSNDSKIYWFTTIHVAPEGLWPFVWQLLLFKLIIIFEFKGWVSSFLFFFSFFSIDILSDLISL